jgi:hypothetical protein
LQLIAMGLKECFIVTHYYPAPFLEYHLSSLNPNTSILYSVYRKRMSGYLQNRIFFWQLLGLSSRMALNWEAPHSAVNSCFRDF